jgi:hypothetical protein
MANPTKISLTLLLISLLLPPRILADKLDSLLQAHDTTRVTFFLHSVDSIFLRPLHTITTTRLDGFHRYAPNEAGNLLHTNLGNVGLACHPLFFLKTSETGFNFGMRSFDLYTRNSLNTRYFQHNLPVSYLSYANGAKKEQLFRVMLGVKLWKAVSFAIDFNLINSPGTYNRQKSDNQTLSVSGQYYTKNHRYGVIANYQVNKLLVLENGGILNDSLFENNVETDRRLIDVNLETAQNLVKVTGAGFNQFFFLSRTPSLPSDSLAEPEKVFNLGRLSHTFDFSRKAYVYTDSEPLSGLYSPYDPPLDSTDTYDSTRIMSVTNRISWNNMGNGQDIDDKIIFLEMALSHQYNEISGYAPKDKISLLIPEASLILNPAKFLRLGFHGSITLGDYQSGDYTLSGNLTTIFRRKTERPGRVIAEASLSGREPDYFYSFYQSNRFRWDTDDLDKESVLRLSLKYVQQWIHAGITFLNIGNYTYLDQDVRPVQAGKTLQVLSVYFFNPFRVKSWTFETGLVYQRSYDKEVLRLPVFTGRAGIYPTLSLFRNAAVLQPGVDVYYNTAYYADAYMPALRHFYLQDGKKVGNFLYIDLYINLMIQRFRLFARMQHFNALFSPNNYYHVPHYPLQDAAFKFGLSWAFYD